MLNPDERKKLHRVWIQTRVAPANKFRRQEMSAGAAELPSAPIQAARQL